MKTNSVKHYLGNPCKYGHEGIRYVKTNECLQCAKLYYINNRDKLLEREREYRNKHPERRAEIERKWRIKNPAKAKQRGLNYYRNNKEQVQKRTANNYSKKVDIYKERHHKHYINNKHQYRAKDAKRRAFELRATPVWLTRDHFKQIEELYKLSGCGFEVDHIVPLCGTNVSGLHVPWNLQVIDCAANRKKSNRF